jgi:myo-inositol-hexaphosphate 3-phosphohydrolase
MIMMQFLHKFFRPVFYLSFISFVLLLCSLQVMAQQVISPLFVSEPVKYDSDDPAIWINKENPAASLLIGTDKNANGALYVYNMEGKIITEKIVKNLQRPNNVDVAYGLLLKGKNVDIAVTTESYAGKLRIFSLPDMQAVDNGGIEVFAGETEISYNEPKGIGLYKRPSDGKIFAIVSRKSGPTDETYLWQYLLEDDGLGNVKGTLVRKFGKFSGKQEIEAVAVDQELGYVYYSDERVGVRKYFADPEKGNQELALFATSGFASEHEGIAIYKIEDGTGYILVSDQQANEMHIYPREGTSGHPHDHPLLKVVTISATSTDGIEIANYPIAPHFLNGIFVAMSNDKTFHLYRWEDIAGSDLKVQPPASGTTLVPPALHSPANNATNVSVSPTLSWYDSSGASSYQVQVSSSSSFSTLAFTQTGIQTTSVQVSGLSGNTLYYWRVRASNATETSSWSSVWSFATESTSPPPVTLLAGHWKMDEGSGTLLLDASGNSNTASTVNGPSWVTGVSGQALRLSGNGQYATVPDNASLDITGSITLALWIRPEALANQYLLHKALVNVVDGYELSLTSAGLMYFRFNQVSAGETYRVNSSSYYPSDGKTWVHLAATYDGATARLYVDGVENRVKAFSSPPPIAANNRPLGIGAQSDGFRPYKGTMDEARVYSRALSAAEVKELATGGEPTSPTVPAAPLLASPANNATGISITPTLGWHAATGAENYQAQISTSSGFTTTVFDQSGNTSTSAKASGLSQSTVYYWRVRTFNSAGTSAWSSVWKFTTELAPTQLGALVGHWQMDEGSGNVLLDASGYNNNAPTKGGPTWVAGVAGLALKLNGKNHYATAPDKASLNMTQAITLSAWIKPEKTANQDILKKAVDRKTNGYELSLSSTGQVFLRFNQTTYGDSYRLNSTSTYPTNGTTWMHIAATFDGTVMKIYINGVENSSKVLSSPLPIAINSVVLGIGAQPNGSNKFQGSLDEARIFNRALSASEVKELAINPAATIVSMLQASVAKEIMPENDFIAYPTAFSDHTTLVFTSSHETAYTLDLYDLKGALVKHIAAGNAEQGRQNKYELKAAGLSRGLYFARLITDQGVQTVKIILQR